MRARRAPAVVFGVLLLLAVAAWVGVPHLRFGSGDCSRVSALSVSVAPELAPAVEAAAARLTCAQVSVAARDSALVAENLAGVDVWIPSSTTWLRRAQAGKSWDLPVRGTSVAMSPVVLGLTEEAAAGLGMPTSWNRVLADLRVGLPDPARDPVGLSVVVGARQLAADSAELTVSLRKLSAGVGASDGPAVALSEQALLKHNRDGAGKRLVPVYPDPAVPALDYPFTVLPQARDRDTAQALLSALLETPLPGDLRSPDGHAAAEQVVERVEPVAVPEPDVVDEVLNQWAVINLSGRLHILLDVSGSMGQAVPGTGKNRMAVTVGAAEAGFGIVKSTTKVGVWLFSTNLDGDRDHRELLPVKTVAEHLASGSPEKLRSVRAIEGGATGLYDSVLAGYRSARENWESGRLNVVVVMTDGRNEDPAGISRETLLAELAALQDPRRPLPVVALGIGGDADLAELTEIASATGGKAFTTPDPAAISGIFHTALSGMLCQPPSCKP
ncbi:substrate-binding domain-containing protein [Saccharothrix sp.]|uniref:substrate-binding domain-containing protein n=1 Tax=Saccharothrix sp. TaxID=1873460 RepID=UPI00281263FA|nr:substrate-binding domain-containing protein [Saccharothrix sp.]